MPRTSRPPAYRLHKRSGQAIVTILGKDHYLGPHGSAKSKEAYAQLISECSANNRSDSPISPVLRNASTGRMSMLELLAAFWLHAEEYHVGRDGRANSEQKNYHTLIARLRRFAGDLEVADFGPRRLRQFRDTLIDEKLARLTINSTINRVRAIFKWGVGHELVPASLWESLKAVEPLRYGKCNAVESEPIRPVPDAWVEAVLPYCSSQVRSMIELQRLTGMRSGEVVIMRTCDINQSDTVWTYTPTFHKTAYRGHSRVVFLGPQAQQLLKPWLRSAVEEFLFSPAEAEAVRLQELHARRKVPLSCGNRPGSNRKRAPRKEPGERYDTGSYGKSIVNALRRCNRDRKKRGEVPIHWHPHQLRHNAATRLRREFGLEVARVVLGHKHAAITEVYAEVDYQRAAEVMKMIG